jgi:poly-gamma-glutamate synthesis protein (capsule biosynthesis protein)
MLGRGVAQALDRDWEAAFTKVQPWLSEADVTFANLESPLTTAPQIDSGYDLRAPPEAVAALHTAGFDVVSLVNNHALDAGEAGLRDTVATLTTAAIVPLADESTCRQSTSHCFLAFDDSAVPLDLEAAAKEVVAAVERANVVVVSIHWGGEYQGAPSQRQQAIARALAEAGADIVVGHGPHVLQRVEWIGNALVAHSLGNFLFDQPYPADCRQGAILRIAMRDDRIVAIEAIPTVVEQGRVRPAGEEEANAILARLDLQP